jgi:hypothetical protein
MHHQRDPWDVGSPTKACLVRSCSARREGPPQSINCSRSERVTTRIEPTLKTIELCAENKPTSREARKRRARRREFSARALSLKSLELSAIGVYLADRIELLLKRHAVEHLEPETGEDLDARVQFTATCASACRCDTPSDSPRGRDSPVFQFAVAASAASVPCRPPCRPRGSDPAPGNGRRLLAELQDGGRRETGYRWPAECTAVAIFWNLANWSGLRMRAISCCVESTVARTCGSIACHVTSTSH